MAERALLRPFYNDVTFTTGQTKTFDFPMVHYRTLSLVISAKDDGGGPGDDMTLNVYMEVNGVFVLHPVAQGGTIKMNELFFFTNEDIHSTMRAEVIAGVNPPSDGVDVQLWAWRP